MKILIVPALALMYVIGTTSCGSKGSDLICDTTCISDTIKFSGDYKLKPVVFISANGCKPDTIAWSYSGLGMYRKAGFNDLMNTVIPVNKDFIRVFFRDTAYAWVLFNDCTTGRGYQLKLPFNDKDAIGRKSSGINNLDPKFSVENSLVAYTDRGNLFVEEMATGKKAMMTFGEETEMDYDVIHETLDSVNITPTRVWVKVKLKDGWKELEKKIELE
jgi:hypothetical protein